MGDHAAMVLVASPELHVGADTELRYAVDSELYYLTGYVEPECVLVLTREGLTLFVRPRDAERELWTGVRGGVEAAQSLFGASAAFPIDALAVELPKLLSGVDRVFARARSGRADVDALILSAVAGGRSRRARSGRGPLELIDPGVVLDEMRLFKAVFEIEAMRNAAAISVAGFRGAAAAIADGRGEWEIEALLQYGFRSRRASGEAFPSIVASGANATVLHYTTNDEVMSAGSLVLIDAGARASLYCGDITRTYAVGKVDHALQSLHDIVRSAHDAAIAVCRPGSTLYDVDQAARRELIRGMIDLGLVSGVVDDVLAGDEYKQFYPHRTCHWLGLDVHDVGAYVDASGAPRVLEPGMVFTVEPGLYVPLQSSARAPLRGAGVRLEDDVLITAGGCEVLTSSLPLDISPEAAA
jgi:Xaa-Pro aminopeptidase